ncbi:MAG: helix-turn-helix domain-containing protein [Verrucomicrobiota bacterium]|jgi:AraC-like DNA-binding protein
MIQSDNPEIDAWRKLAASPTVREQQVAFTCATGVPLTLSPASAHALAEGTFCVKGCLGGHSGETCRHKLLQAEKRAVTRLGPVQYSCPSGLVKILVPVFIGGGHAGILLAGPLALHALDAGRLEQLADRLEKAGLGGRAGQLQTTWRYSPRLSAAKCHAAETLLRMFAKYLEEAGKQYLQAQTVPPSPLLQKIEAFLGDGRDGQVSLKEVAACVNLSPCHFCAVFKKQTGLTFSRYRVRQRLAKARGLLADGARRISDVAFESGFESIPYFNRAFRQQFDCSPTEYRHRLSGQNPGQENQNPGVAQNRGGRFNNKPMKWRLPGLGR